MTSKKLNKAIVAAAMEGKTLDQVEDDKAIAQELVDKIAGMIKDRDAKCESAKDQLIESLKITADKYRTATGVMEALRVMRMVEDGSSGIPHVKYDIEQARSLAVDMAKTAECMAEIANALKYEKMDNLCEGFYEADFAENDITPRELMEELMCLDLCRNVGPAAEDIVEFYKHATEDIDDTQSELDELIKKHPEFAKITPTPKEN